VLLNASPGVFTVAIKPPPAPAAAEPVRTLPTAVHLPLPRIKARFTSHSAHSAVTVPSEASRPVPSRPVPSKTSRFSLHSN